MLAARRALGLTKPGPPTFVNLAGFATQGNPCNASFPFVTTPGDLIFAVGFAPFATADNWNVPSGWAKNAVTPDGALLTAVGPPNGPQGTVYQFSVSASFIEGLFLFDVDRVHQTAGGGGVSLDTTTSMKLDGAPEQAFAGAAVTAIAAPAAVSSKPGAIAVYTFGFKTDGADTITAMSTPPNTNLITPQIFINFWGMAAFIELLDSAGTAPARTTNVTSSTAGSGWASTVVIEP